MIKPLSLINSSVVRSLSCDAAGRGYQTMINEALREYLGRSRESVDASTIRRIVREELRKTR